MLRAVAKRIPPETQAALFEPTGAEVFSLAMHHAKLADQARSQAQIAKARHWGSIAAAYLATARIHETESELLAMLADFEALGGVAK